MKPAAKVSILIVNYQTPQLTKLCLRLIKKNTPLEQVKVIVVDNGSKDESLEYLRSLAWIELIERAPIPHEPVHLSHAHALDLALAKVDTPYVLSLHTDTFVHHPHWLTYLLSFFTRNPQLAGVGSWKLERKPRSTQALKKIENFFQKIFYSLIKKQKHALEGIGENYFYLRSHCALYRMDLIKKYGLSFAQNEDIAGKIMHKSLIDAGHEMYFIDSKELLHYLDHVNHGTMILNPHLGASKRTIQQGYKRLVKRLGGIDIAAILADERLD